MVGEPNGLAALAAVLRYLADTHGRETLDKVVKMMEERKRTRTKQGNLTWAAEVALEGRAKSLMKLLAARFGEVPAEVAAKVKASEDEEALERWAVRVLTAPTPEAVIDDGEDAGRPARSARKPAARKRAQRASGARRAS
jgi:hypothetical protein